VPRHRDAALGNLWPLYKTKAITQGKIKAKLFCRKQPIKIRTNVRHKDGIVALPITV